MVRILPVICVLSVAPLLAQSQGSGYRPQSRPSPASLAKGAAPQPPVRPAADVAPDSPVVTIHGLCPEGQSGSSGKHDSCTFVLTRQQFETMVASINISNQTFSKPALRNLAASYVTVLALAAAGEKAGVDKDPRFQELMKVARTRTLADAYRRYLREKYANPSPEEIAGYYKQNPEKFQQVKIERIMIPRFNRGNAHGDRVEFAKKAHQMALDLRERAARGEDMEALQREAYASLGIHSQPPQTELTFEKKGHFLPQVQRLIEALKPGEVTKVQSEPSGFEIYKLRSRTVLPLALARGEIVHELSLRNVDAALKAATSDLHTDFNEQFFNPYPAGPPRIPPGMVAPGKGPMGRPAAPAAGATPHPATKSNAPAQQKTRSPK